MTRESLAFALSGTFFGLLAGWIIASQVVQPSVPPSAQAPTASAAPAAQAPPLDSARISQLEQQAAAEPDDASPRTELGNLYFDAERPDLAIPWYEAAATLSPSDVNVSTDLAVSYYYTNQPDRALAQIDRSLALDPSHLKTLLNQGIIRAFGKQDLAGAAESWERVVAIAPGSPEGLRAQQGLEGLRAAHEGGAVPGGAGGSAP
jgi:cytochrome c-type biogenesis protein CcmH/NrfG